MKLEILEALFQILLGAVLLGCVAGTIALVCVSPWFLLIPATLACYVIGFAITNL